jgi:hypothetical protein
MVDAKLLSGELSLWSAVLFGQGEKDWADLLDRAAVKLSQGERDGETATSLRLYAVVTSRKDQAFFHALLERATDLLTPANNGQS